MSSALTALSLSLVVAAPSAKGLRVFIDPGHGLAKNNGTQTVLGEMEASSNLRVAQALATRLPGHAVKLARKTTRGPKYPARAEAARTWKADVLLSIHADARGEAKQSPCLEMRSMRCPRNDTQPGFAILVNDKGDPKMVQARLRLARAVARKMSKFGFTPYNGVDYGSLYEQDGVAGVFLDRRGLFMLRRPKMPSVIIETHHAWHAKEAWAWTQAKTFDRFGKAVRAALGEFQSRGP